ncbi:hypothetical protein AVEN_86838-1 [Araneus ventricosus]|uniref:Uncharacterized protein n=1 Tax=Araneus ventricosus TaxID=182803 RepID=A0A4Y2D334_ARAVE|nr:hypothetical protein AVEN_86838-1 [Araneus ventricosus]
MERLSKIETEALKSLILYVFENNIVREPKHPPSCLPILMNYINDCHAEVKVMKSTLLHENIPFYAFVISGWLNTMPLTSASCTEIALNHILDVSTTKGYPIYRDVIASKLHRPALLKKVLCLGIHARHNGKTTFLYSDAVLFIIKHLSNADILNLLLAYSGLDPDVGVPESSNVNKRKFAVSEVGSSSANEKSDPICGTGGIEKAWLSELQKSAKKSRSLSANSPERVSNSIITRSKKTSSSETASGKKVQVPEVKSSVKSGKGNCISVVNKSTKTKRASSRAETAKRNNCPLSMLIEKIDVSQFLILPAMYEALP